MSRESRNGEDQLERLWNAVKHVAGWEWDYEAVPFAEVMRRPRYSHLKNLLEAAAAQLFTASETRDTIIEDVAKHIEEAPLTYFGPDPGGVKDLKFLIVAAIRDMKGSSGATK